MAKIIRKKGVTHFTQLQLFGSEEKIGNETIRIILRDNNGDILLATGTTVPTANTSDYAKGCLFIETDAAGGARGLYENRGTNTACSFYKVGMSYKAVDVTVAGGDTTGSSAADSELVGGVILGIYPTGNQDQFVDNVVLNADGSISVTLGAAATADNTFKVVALRL